jgi:hypothetical protein
MIRSLLAIAVACSGIGLSGCAPESGFVEIKRKVALHRDDVLMVNKTAVPNFAGRESAVIKQPPGMTTLTLKRGERIEKLCEFPISKNRLTTVTLTAANALVRCTTQS